VFVGDAFNFTYYYYDWLRPSLCLHNFFQAKNAFYGTYGRSAKFQYFHISMLFILPNGTPQQAGITPLAQQRYE
jgi:hypothetical protein